MAFRDFVLGPVHYLPRPEVQVRTVVVEKVVVKTGREYLTELWRHADAQANWWPEGFHSDMAYYRRLAWAEVAQTLFTTLARPWFEEE